MNKQEIEISEANIMTNANEELKRINTELDKIYNASPVDLSTQNYSDLCRLLSIAEAQKLYDNCPEGEYMLPNGQYTGIKQGERLKKKNREKRIKEHAICCPHLAQ